MALSHKDPAGAIAALEPTRPLELVRCELIGIRADAYLASHQPEKAAVEYRKLIANPGLENIMQPRAVVAHLGLARALAQQTSGPRANRSTKRSSIYGEALPATCQFSNRRVVTVPAFRRRCNGPK